jgi:AcrR family transcriptional regulator
MTTTETAERPLRADARRNREAIIDAARAIVAEQGVEAQIQDVARKAGLGVGTVYRHFATKDALMGALVSMAARDNAAMARQAMEAEDPWEGFAGLVRTCCETMAADAAKRRSWQVASDAAMAYAADAKAEMIANTTAVIERAHDAGVLREDFVPLDMPGLMCGLAAAIDAQVPGGWKRLVEFSLDGLRTR